MITIDILMLIIGFAILIAVGFFTYQTIRTAQAIKIQNDIHLAPFFTIIFIPTTEQANAGVHEDNYEPHLLNIGRGFALNVKIVEHELKNHSYGKECRLNFISNIGNLGPEDLAHQIKYVFKDKDDHSSDLLFNKIDLLFCKINEGEFKRNGPEFTILKIRLDFDNIFGKPYSQEITVGKDCKVISGPISSRIT